MKFYVAQVYQHLFYKLRVVYIENKLYFVLKDLVDILEYGDEEAALNILTSTFFKSVMVVDDKAGNATMEKVVNLSELWALAYNSKAESVKDIRIWLDEVVSHAITKLSLKEEEML